MSRFPIRGADFDASEVFLGAAAGLVAGIPMGVILHLGTDLLPVIGAVSGEPSIVVGWIVHLAVSIGAGVSFAVFVALPLFHEVTRSVAGCVIVGILNAFGMAAVFVGLILPIFVDIIGANRSELVFPFGSVPGPAVDAMFGAVIFAMAHIVYGTVLGVVYAYAHGVSAEELSPKEDPSQRTPDRGDP